jgi:putative PIN family toxin of toxin-antitoxin system
MRLLVDTNLYVSYFLNLEKRAETVSRVLALALAHPNELVIPFIQMAELSGISSKPKLAGRIPAERWQAFLAGLQASATILPADPRPIPRIVRDPKDDYLIATALFEDVDVLISGDKDLLVLREHLNRPRIMSPAEFVSELADPASWGVSG